MGNAQEENMIEAPVVQEQTNNQEMQRTTPKENSSRWAWIDRTTEWCQQNLLYVSLVVAACLGARMWCFALQVTDAPFDRLLKLCLEQTICLNVLVMIYLAFVTIVWLRHICSDKSSWWHLCMYPIIGACILYIPQWTPIQTAIPEFIYPHLLVCCLTVIWLVELGVLIYNKANEEKYTSPAECDNGFVVKTKQNDLLPSGWEKHVETIFELVGKKQLEEESFAIGIAGTWGSGKTTFYDAVKKHIDKKKEFVFCEFKPWQILDPNRIAPEFFSEFAKVISSDDKQSQLHQEIIKYAQLLTTVPHVSPYAQALTSLLELNHDSTITSTRKAIDKKLKDGDRYVAVMIDDLDRLNKEELFEIMRLVRASANFKHVLFILTYDKGYFARILGEKIGLEYLKKIVNLEISLPPIELYKYGQLLQQSITSIFNANITKDKKEKRIISKQLVLLANLISEENTKAETSVLYEHLHNFRDIKRFANQYGLALRHITKSGLIESLNFHDLFWLEVLHYADEDTYNILRDNYSTLLQFKSSPLTKQRVLTLKDNIPNGRSPKLLKQVFGRTNDFRPINSVVWVNNYYNFFTYRQVDNYVSTVEFSLLMNDPNPDFVMDKVFNWLKYSYNRSSVEQILHDFPQNRQFDSEIIANNYTYILLKLLRKTRPFSMDELVVGLFKQKYHPKYFRKIPSYSPFDIIKNQIENFPNRRWNMAISAMCVSHSTVVEYANDNNMQMFDTEVAYILNMNQLRELAQLNYTLCFKNSQLRITTLFNPASEQMNFILDLQYVEQEANKGSSHEDSYNNLIGEYVLTQINNGRRRKLYTHDTLIVICNNLMKLAKVTERTDEDRARHLIYTKIEQTLGAVKTFETFIENNFDMRDERNVKLCKSMGLIVAGKNNSK